MQEAASAGHIHVKQWGLSCGFQLNNPHLDFMSCGSPTTAALQWLTEMFPGVQYTSEHLALSVFRGSSAVFHYQSSRGCEIEPLVYLRAASQQNMSFLKTLIDMNAVELTVEVTCDETEEQMPLSTLMYREAAESGNLLTIRYLYETVQCRE